MDLKRKIAAGVGALLVSVSAVVPALAADGDSATIASTMSTALTTVQSDFMSTVNAIAPIALTIFGVFLVWKLGLRFFKSITGR